jgi:hypothetical protein
MRTSGYFVYSRFCPLGIVVNRLICLLDWTGNFSSEFSKYQNGYFTNSELVYGGGGGGSYQNVSRCTKHFQDIQ